MRTPPANWNTLMAQPHETETRVDIAGASYYGYNDGDGIWSCETKPMLFDKLSVGNCCSSAINLVLAQKPQHMWRKFSVSEQFAWDIYAQSRVYRTSFSYSLTVSNFQVVQLASGVQKINGVNSFTPLGAQATVRWTQDAFVTADILNGAITGMHFAYIPAVAQNDFDIEIMTAYATGPNTVRINGARLVQAGAGEPQIIAGSQKAGRYYSPNRNTYPNCAEYNNEYTVLRTQKEQYRDEYIGMVYSDDENAYPQDGQSGDYWYVYDGIGQRLIPAMAKMELYVRLRKENTKIDEIVIPKGRIKGDINGDGIVNDDGVPWEQGGRGDVIYATAYIAGLTTLDTMQKWCGNVVSSSGVHINDVTAIRNRANGNYDAYTNLDYYENWTWRSSEHDWTCFLPVEIPQGAHFELPDGYTSEIVTGGMNIYATNPPIEPLTVDVYGTLTTDWVRKGIYYIDTREWDAQHEFLTITGYDAMLKAEQPYYKPPVTITGWPKVDTAVVSEICTRIGVELDERTVLDKGYMIPLPAVSSDGSDSDTLREVLGWVGGMYGGNWCITDEGKLRLVPLVPTETVSVGTDALDLTTTPVYDAIGVVHLVVSEDIGYTAPQSGGTGRSIEISCPWGTQDIADNILTAIGGYVYQPLVIITATEANPLWELGDAVTVNGYTSVIAAMPTTFGVKYTADIEAPESEEINHEYPYQDKGTREIQRKIAQSRASLKIDIDAIEAIVTGIAKPYESGTVYSRYSIVFKYGKYYMCVAQQSSSTWVDEEWQEQSSGALSSIIKQTMDSITLSVSAGTNQSTVTMMANGIEVDSAVVRFNRIEADEVSANGISAGTIDAQSGSNAVKLKGGFTLLDANGRNAGSVGGFAASPTLAIAQFSGPSGTTTPSMSLGQLGVGYSDASAAQLTAHAIMLNGGVRLASAFVVDDVSELPSASDYPDGTIAIVVL